MRVVLFLLPRVSSLLNFFIFQRRPIHKQRKKKPVSTTRFPVEEQKRRPLGTTRMDVADSADRGSERPHHRPKRKHESDSIPLGPSSTMPNEEAEDLEEAMADAQVCQPPVPGSSETQVDDSHKTPRMAPASMPSKVNRCWSIHQCLCHA